MQKLFIITIVITTIALDSFAQGVGIGATSFTPHASSQLEIQSSTKGILIPRMTTAQMNAIPSPAKGLIVYDSVAQRFYFFDNGFWNAFPINNDLVWSKNGSHIYKFNTGNVGIGTINPASLLHVFRGTGAGGVLPFGSTVTIENSGDASLSLLTPDANVSAVHFGLNSNNYSGAISYNSSFNRKGFDFRIRAGVTAMLLDSLGNLGIGDLTPGARLKVSGNGNPMNINGTSGAFGGMYMGIYEDDIYRGYWGSYSGAATDVDFGTGGGNTTGKLNLTIQGTPMFSIAANGTAQVLSTNILEFGNGLTKEVNAGKIGYNAFSQNALTFVGAGTTANNRAFYFYNEGGASFGGPIYLERPGLGQRTVEIKPSETGSDGAEILLYNASGVATIELDADFGDGDGRVITRELQITGGSDLAEHFAINKNNKDEVKPGMLVSIDETNEGKLKITNTANDKKIVGVISGANGIKAGMLMSQQGTIADGEYPIALAGRVYVYANNEGGEIEPGDLITSSSQQGYAMKANPTKINTGTIIGKAMGKRDTKTGYVLVLVSLQ